MLNVTRILRHIALGTLILWPLYGLGLSIALWVYDFSVAGTIVFLSVLVRVAHVFGENFSKN